MKKLLFGPIFSGLFAPSFRDPWSRNDGKTHKRQGKSTKKPRIWAILSQAQAMQRDPPQTQHFQPLAGIVVEMF